MSKEQEALEYLYDKLNTVLMNTEEMSTVLVSKDILDRALRRLIAYDSLSGGERLTKKVSNGYDMSWNSSNLERVEVKLGMIEDLGEGSNDKY